MITFTNAQSGFALNFTADDSATYIAEALEAHDAKAVYASSITHCLTGRRTKVGNWSAELDAPMCPVDFYNKTNRTQTKGFTVHDTIPTRSEALIRMQKAYNVAIQTGNRALAATLLPMIQKEQARSVKSTSGSDCNNVVRKSYTVTNPRTMSVKLKAELYNPNIELETPSEIAARKAAYDQKVKVFSRA